MSNQISQARIDRLNRRRKVAETPRAAAIAGIIFAVFFTISIVLIRIAIPEELGGGGNFGWLEENAGMVSLALTLVPFSGIAFLWFVGVIRARLGEFEDQLFSTVFFGSGLLFLAMMFSSAAIAGGIIASYAIDKNVMVTSGLIIFGRAVMYTITNTYASRMAGVFMFSLGTIWIRTRVMPRSLIVLTYILALLLLLALTFSLWLLLIFPVWVFVISVYILYVSMRGETQLAEEIVGANDS